MTGRLGKGEFYLLKNYIYIYILCIIAAKSLGQYDISGQNVLQTFSLQIMKKLQARQLNNKNGVETYLSPRFFWKSSYLGKN